MNQIDLAKQKKIILQNEKEVLSAKIQRLLAHQNEIDQKIQRIDHHIQMVASHLKDKADNNSTSKVKSF